jgi:hypothetical protein
MLELTDFFFFSRWVPGKDALNNFVIPKTNRIHIGQHATWTHTLNTVHMSGCTVNASPRVRIELSPERCSTLRLFYTYI